jgi:putative ABC transport system ATP-binding protein
MAGTPLIRFDHVSKIYGKGETEVRALDDVSLSINDGEFVAIMGPSGSGKSTAMNILGCLDTPTSGRYFFRGVDVGTLNRSQRALLRRNYIGFVFQGFNLLKRTTARENLELPLIYRGDPAAVRRERALKALNLVGLADRANHTSSELSGGQQQRVAIARALVTEPAVIFADEPTGNLDSANGESVMDLLRELHQMGSTICMVTHDERFSRYAERTVHLFDGRVVDEKTKH